MSARGDQDNSIDTLLLEQPRGKDRVFVRVYGGTFNPTHGDLEIVFYKATHGAGLAGTAGDQDGKLRRARDLRAFDQPQVGMRTRRVAAGFRCATTHSSAEYHDCLSARLRRRQVSRIQRR